jgi:hypothetical protein
MFVYNECEVILMAIRDRGKKKWQFAFGMPELIKAQRDVWCDTERVNRPIIDEDEAEEFDQRIAHAIEYNLPVKVIFWSDGFTYDITGRIHFVDSIKYQLRIESETGEFHRIAFEAVVGVAVLA